MLESALAFEARADRSGARGGRAAMKQGYFTVGIVVLRAAAYPLVKQIVSVMKETVTLVA